VYLARVVHAYTSAIDVASDCDCDCDCDCCNCIGPAGAGEWTGPWGDQSEEFTENCEAIAAAFKTDNAAEVVEARDDGTFFMDFEVSAGWGIDSVHDKECAVNRVRIHATVGAKGVQGRRLEVNELCNVLLFFSFYFIYLFFYACLSRSGGNGSPPCSPR